ncbi:hypothetical protein TNCV_422111 [Trichonephila clavipes]|nr:hypothetical protein TNCV_422111 [Trichonephila clavipes]
MTGAAVRKVDSGRPRKAKTNDDRYIILQESRRTVARHLHKGGLFGHRLEYCIPLPSAIGYIVYSGVKIGHFINGVTCPHRTSAVEELPEIENISRINWPVGIPGLNLAGHTWDFFGVSELDLRLPLSVALSTLQVTVRFEREYPIGGQGPPTSLPLPPTTVLDLRLDGYLE